MTPCELTDLQLALAAVWSGADRLDAEAVADHLEDLGWVGLNPAPPPLPRREQAELPLASTKGLTRRRSS